MEYVTERITNISMLESHIEQAAIGAQLIYNELQNDSPSIERLKGLSEEIMKHLDLANNFEFHLERRKTSYTE